MKGRECNCVNCARVKARCELRTECAEVVAQLYFTEGGNRDLIKPRDIQRVYIFAEKILNLVTGCKLKNSHVMFLD